MLDLQRELATVSGNSAAGSSKAKASETSPSEENGFALPPGKKRARVLYDYDAEDSSELKLSANEVIIVSQSDGLGEEWMVTERGNQKGKVPVAYLEILS